MKRLLFFLLLFRLCTPSVNAQRGYKIYSENSTIEHVIDGVSFKSNGSKIVMPFFPFPKDNKFALGVLCLNDNKLSIDYSKYQGSTYDFLGKISQLFSSDSIYRWVFNNNIGIKILPAPYPIRSYQKNIPYAVDFTSLSFYNIDINGIDIFSKQFSYNFENTRIGKMRILRAKNVALISDTLSRIDDIIIYGDSLERLILNGINATCIRIFRPRIANEEIMFLYGTLPDTFFLNKINFESSEAKLNLSSIGLKSGKSKCYVVIKETNVNNIAFNYINFKLAWDSTFKEEDKQVLYKRLLEKFKNEGQVESYANLDIEYIEYSYTKDSTWLGRQQNVIDKWWWNYGYDRTKVVTNTFTIFGLLILFNLLFFPLLFSVYRPKNFVELDERLMKKYKTGRKFAIWYRIHKIPAIIAYTSYVFWGVKLELSEIKFEKSWWALPFLIVLLQYLTGIVCLAYIANLIITK